MRFVSFFSTLLLVTSRIHGAPSLEEISIQPEGPLSITVGYGHDTTFDLDVSNESPSASANLEAFFQDSIGRDLEGVLQGLNDSAEEILSHLPGRYFFSNGDTGNSISDGGGDMYDSGNFLSFNSSLSLFYSNNHIAETNGARYFTLKLDGLFVLVADYGNSSSFNINGNLGADGNGSVTLREFDPGYGYQAFQKSVGGASDSSVNHLIMVPAGSNVVRSAPTTTTNDTHSVSNLPPNGRLYFALFSKAGGELFSPSLVDQFASSLLEHTRSAPSWFSMEPFTLAANSTATVSPVIRSKEIAPGTYEDFFTIAPADTELEDIPASAYQSISLTVNPPAFRIDEDLVRASTLAGTNAETTRLTISPTETGTSLDSLGFESSASWLSGEWLTSENAFALSFDTDGLAVGEYSAEVSISGLDTLQKVTVMVTVEELNIVRLLPDPSRPRLYAINSTGKARGSLLVFDILSQQLIKQLPLEEEPTDMDLTEGAAELLVMNTSAPSIQRIDLDSLTVTETYELTEFSDRNDDFGGHVADGPGDIIYYVDEQWGPRLRTYDTSTRSVLQTFGSQSEITPNTGNDHGYGDIVVSPDRSLLFGWRQYGDGAGSSGTHIVRFDIAATGELQSFTMGSSSSAPNFDRDPFDTPALISSDGETLVVKNRKINQGNINTVEAVYPDEVLSISPLAEILVGADAIYPTLGREILHEFPKPYRVQTVLPDYSYFVAFDTSEKELVWLNLLDTLGADELGLEIFPENNSIVITPSELRWLPVSGITSYEIYLGTSESAVRNATPSSAEFIGTSSTQTFTLPDALDDNTTYYWRAVPAGRTGGEVFSFQVSALLLSQSQIDFRGPAGVLNISDTVEINASTATDWTVSTDADWLTISANSGTTPSTITLSANTTGLASGFFETTLQFTVGTSQFEMPVTLLVDDLNFSLVEADPVNPFIYLISQESTNSLESSYLIKFDPVSREMVQAVECGRSVTDLAIHNKENRIYLTNHETGILRAFDLDSLEQEQSYQFTPRAEASSGGDAYRVFAGRQGRIIVSEYNQWIEFWLINTETGERIASGSGRAGQGVFDPSGRYYYHLNLSNSVARYDTINDTLDDYLSVTAGTGSTILTAGDGSRLVKGQSILAPDLEEIGTVPGINSSYPDYESARALTRGGEFVFTDNRVFNTSNGLVVATLPLKSSLIAITADQSTAFQFALNSTTFSSFDLSTLGEIATGIEPHIADSGVVNDTNQRLSWSMEASALSYDVYFGTSQAAVDAATLESSEFLGNTASNDWATELAGLSLDTTYYWRVDFHNISTVVKGDVWSFHVAPIVAGPRAVQLDVLANAPVRPQALTTEGPAGLSWSASTSTPWLEVTTATGQAGEEVTFAIIPASLPSPTGTTSIKASGAIDLSSGGSSFQVPINLEIDPFSYTLLEADVERPFIYLISEISQTDERPGYLVRFNTNSETITDAIPVGNAVTSFDIHYRENRIYLPNHVTGLLRAFDRETLNQVQTYQLGTRTSGDDVYRVYAGREGRLLYTGYNQWITMHLMDTADGTSLAESSHGTYQGPGVISPDGTTYYHAEQLSSDQLKSFDLSEDQITSSVIADFDNHFAPVSSGDGSLLAQRIVLFSPSLEEVRTFDSFDTSYPHYESIKALSYRGNLTVSNKTIYNSTNGEELADLPVITDLIAFSSDQEKLFLFESDEYTPTAVDLTEIIELPPAGIVPGIADNSMIIGSSQELDWTLISSALSYDVYLGSDETAVLNAQPNSELHLGNTTTNSWSELIEDLELGATYFWRVDINGLNGTRRGEAWSFTVAPIETTPRIFHLDGPKGMPSVTHSALMSGPSNSNWQASTTTPWLSVETTAGTVGGNLTFAVEATHLAPGEYEGSIRVTTDGTSFQLPVNLTIHNLNISRFETVPDSEKVLALSMTPAVDGPSFLLEIDGSDATISRFATVGREALDFSFLEGEEEVFILTQSGEEVISFDRSSWSASHTIELEYAHETILATPSNTLLLTRGYYLYPIDADTGASVGTNQNSRNSRISRGTLADDGVTIYRRTSNAVQITYQTLEEEGLSPVGPIATINSGDFSILVTDGARRVFAGQKVFDAELNFVTDFDETIRATDRNGLVAIGESSVFWGESGQLVQVLGESASTAAITSDDQYILRFVDEEQILESIRLDNYIQLPGVSPQPYQISSNPPATFSIPGIGEAEAYLFYLGTSRDSMELVAQGSEPTFDAPQLSHFEHYFWRIDRRISRQILTGEVYQFSLIPSAIVPEGLVNGTSVTFLDRELVTSSSRYPYFDISTHQFDFETGEIGTPRSFDREETTTSSIYGEQVVKAGDSYFTLESNGIARITVDPLGFTLLDETVPLPGSAIPDSIAASGDLLFISTQADSTGNSLLHVYRTFPELVLEQTISTPTGITLRNFAASFAAADSHLALRGTMTLGNATTESIFIYRRSHQTSRWNLQQIFNTEHDIISSSYSSGRFSIATDKQRIIVASTNSSGIPEITILFSNNGGRFNVESYFATSDFAALTSLSSRNTVRTAIDRDIAAVSVPGANGDRGSGVLLVFQNENNNWKAKPAIALDNKIILEEISLANGWLVNKENAQVLLFRVADQSPNPVITSPRPFQLVANRPFSFPLSTDGLSEASTFSLQPQLSWAQIGGTSSAPTLSGNTPSGLSSQTIRLTASTADGGSYTQTFDVALLSENDIPVIESISESFTAGEGQNHTLRTTVSGTGPFSYQWFKDGEALSGETRNRLSLRSLTFEDTGSYTVTITNAVETTTSEPISVTVTPANRNGGDWTTFGNDPAHLGHHPASLGTHTFLPAWDAMVRGEHDINRAAIADGKVFTTPLVYFGGPVNARAFDLDTGEEIWAHEFEEARSLNPPSYFNGRIYLQRGNHSGDTQLWALDAETGESIWSAAHTAQWEIYEAPAVNDDGIYINGGSYGGLYGFDHDGNQLFFEDKAQYDEWTPTLIDGKLYSWVAGNFTEHNPYSGDPIWNFSTSWDWRGWSMKTVSAVTTSEALLISTTHLNCLDLESREIRWQVESGFSGSPAVFGNEVFALKSYTLPSYDLATGSLQTTYRNPSLETFISGQPLLLNDYLIAATEKNTYIYRYGVEDPVQTIPVGGRLSYSNGYLIIARNDGQISAFYANDVPDLPEQEIPEVVEDIPFSHQLMALHDDDDESLNFSLLDGPEWISLSSSGALSGTLLHNQGGLQTIEVEVSDGATDPVRRSFTFAGFEVNDTPTASRLTLTVDEDSAPLTSSFWDRFDDEESADSDLVYRIVANSNPSLLQTGSPVPESFTMTPLQDQYGEAILRLEATDEGGLMVETTATITVLPVNDVPVFTSDLPDFTANPAADPITADLTGYTFDADPDDQMRYAVVANTNETIFSSVTLGATNGELSLVFAPYVSGSATLTIRITDLEGTSSEATMEVTLPDIPPPTISAGAISLNRQTGLFEQRVTVTNGAARAIGGFQLHIDNLANGYQLWGHTSNTITHQQPLAAGSSLQLMLEYYSASSGLTPSPSHRSETALPATTPAPEILGVAVDRILCMEDHSVLLEFNSEPGSRYAIQYSYDMEVWYQSPVVIEAGTNRTQWLDQGMPRTDQHPADCDSRMYRVLQLPN
ncbi:PQQ-binding-like beta-propeller repeat protein [Roseibacillus persicicus]|uniref:outer membrane protein assembly factor BamB family protein n=1 Tax=Roseibacillus persicicus TaxID=454148 RepID=UPI00398B9BEA